MRGIFVVVYGIFVLQISIHSPYFRIAPVLADLTILAYLAR